MYNMIWSTATISECVTVEGHKLFWRDELVVGRGSSQWPQYLSSRDGKFLPILARNLSY